VATLTTERPDHYQPTGVVLALFGDVHFGIELYRAPDSGGAPGTWALLATLPAGTDLYTDGLPETDATYWYKARHVASGYDPGPYTSAVSTKATELSDNPASPGDSSLPGAYPAAPILASEVGVIDLRYPYCDPRRFGADPTGVLPSDTALANIRASFANIAQAIPEQSNFIRFGEGMYLLETAPAKLLYGAENIGGLRGAATGGTTIKLNDTTLTIQVPPSGSGTQPVSNAAAATGIELDEDPADTELALLVDDDLDLVTTDTPGTGANNLFTRTAGVWVVDAEIGRVARFINAYGVAIGPFTVTDNDATTLTFTGNATGAVTLKQTDFSVGTCEGGSATGVFHRVSGSFIDDGFAPGMLVTALGYTNYGGIDTNHDYVVSEVTGLDLSVEILPGIPEQISSSNARSLSQSANGFIDSIIEIVAGIGAGQKRFVRMATANLGGGITYQVDNWEVLPDPADSTYRVVIGPTLFDIRPAGYSDKAYNFSLGDFTIISDVAHLVPVTAVRCVAVHGFKGDHVRVNFHDPRDCTSQGLVVSGHDESEYEAWDIVAARPQSFQATPGYELSGPQDTTSFRNFKRYVPVGSTATVAGTGSDGTFTAAAIWTTDSEVGKLAECYLGSTLIGTFLVTANTTTVLTLNGDATTATSVILDRWHGTTAGIEFSAHCGGASRLTFDGLQMNVGGNGAIHCVTTTYMYHVNWSNLQYEQGVDTKTRPSVNLDCGGGTLVGLHAVSLGGYDGKQIFRFRRVTGLTVLGSLAEHNGTSCPLDIDGTCTNVHFLGMSWIGGGTPGVEPPLPVPLRPTVTQGGTQGTKHDTYVVVAYSGNAARTNGSPPRETLLAHAVLDETNYNIVTWPAVTAATYSTLGGYDVYRTATDRSVTTGVTSLSSTVVPDPATGGYTTTYHRAAGSFVADGFLANMTVTPVGFADVSVKLVASVEALTLVMQQNATPAASEAATGNESLTGVSIGKLASVAAGTETYHDHGALGDGTVPPQFNGTGIHLVHAAGLCSTGLWSDMLFSRTVAQEVSRVGDKMMFSEDVIVGAGEYAVLNTQILQVAGSGNTLEIEASWNQGLYLPPGGGKWLMAGNYSATLMSRLVYGSPDASDLVTDPNCIAIVCESEGLWPVGWVKLYNSKSVARTVHLTYWSSPGSATADELESVTWPTRCPSLLTGLLDYWSMDAGSVGVNANNGVNTAVGFNAGAGKIKHGAGFTYAGQSKIALTDATALKPTTALSLAAWVYILDTTYAYGVIQNYNQTGSVMSGFSLVHNTTAGFDFILGKNSNLVLGDGYQRIVSVAVATPGVWAHAVATYDQAANGGAGEMKLYLNAVLKDTKAWNKTIVYASNVPLIGARNLAGVFSGWMNGSLDEVGLWSRALTPAEVTALYAAGAGLAYPF
jgi:hypothetical protein